MDLSRYRAAEYDLIRSAARKALKRVRRTVHDGRNDVRVENDSKEWIGNDRHLIVSNDLFEKIEKNKHAIVKADLKQKVEGNANLTVAGDLAEEISGDASSPLAGWPMQQAGRYGRRYRRGCFFTCLMGHGQVGHFISMPLAGGRVLLSAKTIGKELSAGPPGAPMLILACHCGNFA